MSKNNEKIAEKLIEAITKTGTLPWQKPWGAPHSWPRNATTRRPYTGGNAVMLYMSAMAEGRTNLLYLTYNQAVKAGGHVRKGEVSTQVLFWGRFKKATVGKDGDDIFKMIPVARVFSLFHISQVDGLPEKMTEPQQPGTACALERPDHVVAGMQLCPPIVVGDKASYNPALDRVQMPALERFHSSEEYYSTLFHELVHATGHDTRLKRGFKVHDKECYSKEELVAEMGAAFLCGHCGILQSVENNSAAYLAGWLGAIKGEPDMLLKAASQAQKAYDFIVGTKQEEPHTEEPGVLAEETV